MPRRDDLRRILILGSGPIVIGQAAEFDYSGAQACKVLAEEGYEVDPRQLQPGDDHDRPGVRDRHLHRAAAAGAGHARSSSASARDALLPTLGGQTALNLARALHEDGTLERYGVELIGAELRRDPPRRGPRPASARRCAAPACACRAARSRPTPPRRRAALERDRAAGDRAARLHARRPGRRHRPHARGVRAGRRAPGSRPRRSARSCVEESVLGWGEFELEVMRDRNDNVVIVCSIENIDPMGVHTGDSLTVAPQQSLTDAAYQRLRDQAITVIRAVGVETGGSNVQFAVNPRDGEIVVIEMNPRVSRSSALASKATGFPIAKIAARLAVGYALEEIPNDITRATPASFEPTIDYVVVKWPRFAFEKFEGVDAG